MATKRVMLEVMFDIYDDHEKYFKDEWGNPIIKREVYHRWADSMNISWDTLRKAYVHITTKFLLDLHMIKEVVDLYTPDQWATLLHMSGPQKETSKWRILMKELRHQWASRPRYHAPRKTNKRCDPA